MQQVHTSRWLKKLEAGLWVGVVEAAGYGCFYFWESAQARHEVAVEAAQRGGSAAATDGPIVPSSVINQMYAGSARQPEDDGSVIGEFSVPALKLAAPITTGLTKTDLIRGVGHVPGSAMAGGLGNMGLAAHRDTYFRPLRNVQRGMKLLVRSGGDTYAYAVDSTEIVTPDQINVLAIGDVPQLTLITCYPFNYIGAAPKRFIVKAHLLSLIPAEQ